MRSPVVPRAGVLPGWALTAEQALNNSRRKLMAKSHLKVRSRIHALLSQAVRRLKGEYREEVLSRRTYVETQDT